MMARQKTRSKSKGKPKNYTKAELNRKSKKSLVALVLRWQSWAKLIKRVKSGVRKARKRITRGKKKKAGTIHKAKNNRYYIIQANGRAKFISNATAKRRGKRGSTNKKRKRKARKRKANRRKR